MRSPIFREGFAKYGVEATGPHDEAARVMVAGLITELQLGKVERAAERLGRIARIVVWTALQGTACGVFSLHGVAARVRGVEDAHSL